MNPRGPKSNAEIRRFSAVVGGAFLVLGGFLTYKGSGAGTWLLGIGGTLLLVGMLVPAAVRPIERVWMAVAEVMGVVMTYVILTLTFFLVLTPMGVAARLFGRDLMAMRLDPELESYWIPVEADGPDSRPQKPY